MAEERLIDDDKDRKYKIRINEDGEEELVIDDSADEDEESDIPVFEVPVYEEDDEEAASLTPEQLLERERIRREEEEARAERVSALCLKAREKLDEGDYESAKYALSQAEELTDKSGELYCLKLQTLTRGFTDYTAVEECAEAADGVKQYADAESREKLKNMASGLEGLVKEAEELTCKLAEENDSKKQERRVAFARDKQKTLVVLLSTAGPFLCLLIAAIVFGSMMFAKQNGAYLITAIVLGALALVAFICTLVAANKFWTAMRNIKLNERDTSTKLGREYLENKTRLENLKRVYTALNDDLS